MSKFRLFAGAVVLAVTFVSLSAAWDHFIGVSSASEDFAPHVFWLVSAFGGALVARRAFTPISALVWAGLSIAALFLVRSGPGAQSWQDLVAHNAVGLFGSLAAVLVGATLGQWARRGSRPNNSSKPTPLRGAA